MWTTLKKRCPHAHSPNKCKCQPRNNIDQEAALASPHSAHHSQAPRQPAHRFPRGGNYFLGGAITTPSQEIANEVSKEVDCCPELRLWQYAAAMGRTAIYDFATRPSMFSRLTFPFLRRRS